MQDLTESLFISGITAIELLVGRFFIQTLYIFKSHIQMQNHLN
jgi:hypothetical protein